MPLCAVIACAPVLCAMQVWYNEASSEYTVCDGSGEDQKCSDSLWLPDSISDHLTYLNITISRMC